MTNCKRCGLSERPLSRNKLCYRCGIEVQKEAITQMRTKSGPVYDRYLEGVERYEASKTTEEDN